MISCKLDRTLSYPLPQPKAVYTEVDTKKLLTTSFLKVTQRKYKIETGEFFFLQHNIKKLRNNILKSDPVKGTRCLTIGDRSILWEHFENAFEYDQGAFSLSHNQKLTAEHFELSPAAKMRNHLAEDVLDKDMLSLMKVTTYESVSC